MIERIGGLTGHLRGSEALLRELAAQAGIEIDGSGPADIRVNDRRFCDRVLSQGAMGLGESYMDGWWDCHRLDQLVYRILEEDLIERIPRGWRTAVSWLR